MKQQRVAAQERRLLAEVSHLLNQDLTLEERPVLLAAKERLQNNAYLPSLICDLKAELAPLADQQVLSRDVRKLYVKLTENDFSDTGDDGGLGFMFEGMLN